MIGIGIDSDVTRAAIKAIHDVMDRNTCLYDYDTLQFNSQQLCIQLGVPLPSSSSIIESPTGNDFENCSNAVDVAFVYQQIFPNCCRRQLTPHVVVKVGGLSVQSLSGKNSLGCRVERKVVVAHLSFVSEEHQRMSVNKSQNRPNFGNLTLKQRIEQENSAPAATSSNDTAVAYMDDGHPSRIRHFNTTTVDFSTEGKTGRGPFKHGFRTSTASTLEVEMHGLSSSAVSAATVPYDVRRVAPDDRPALISADIQNEQPTHRESYSSIDMLAHVSASIMAEAEYDGGSLVGTDAKSSSKHGKVAANLRELSPSCKIHKNQTRHVVQHTYQDLSHEIPPVIYQNKTDSIPMSTTGSSLAFPIKLHEALSQIQSDKKEQIFGWLPHGRSFKIHSQHDFATMVLPQYFAMTKKSSFLRQLNLYGFRRISDGSYYHERFLRGMKFLCLSMQRQKVNGNGVRAAGNPDEEPNLSAYPSCPPLSSQPLDLNQLSIERRTDTESLSSMTEQYIFGRNNIRINESVSSIDDDRPARSDTENNSLNSSVTCNDDNIDVEIGLDGSLLRMPPLSPSCEVGNQVGVRDSSRQDNFPVKLQRILDELEHDGLTDVISWLPHGRAFMVHNVDRFVQEILPLHFNQTKYTSFQRQLHMYHITRVVQGPDKGAYFHYQLLRSQPELSKRLRRTCTTSTPENGTSKITGSLISHRSSGSDIPKDPKLRAASSITSCPS